MLHIWYNVWFSLLHHDARVDKTHVPVVMGWIYYRCRRAGLGMIAVARTPVSTCVVRCVAFCNHCVDVIFSRFNTRRSKHYACCRHNYTSMAKVRTTQNDPARFCFLAPFWGPFSGPETSHQTPSTHSAEAKTKQGDRSQP